MEAFNAATEFVRTETVVGQGAAAVKSAAEKHHEDLMGKIDQFTGLFQEVFSKSTVSDVRKTVKDAVNRKFGMGN
jgi:hypothetical protein